MLFGILAFIIGLVYGYAKPGKEERWELFKKGIIYGIILGIIYGVIVRILMGELSHLVAGGIVIYITVVFIVIMFIIGTFFGDIIETAIKK